MPHISLSPEFPGIIGLLKYRQDTGRVLSELAETILVKNSTLTRGERELIASYVSYLNECQFCTRSHSAVASALLNGDKALVNQVKQNYKQANISEKLKALLTIAGQVQKEAKKVSAEIVEEARRHGASDLEIHDTVLIAAAFCMYNRYVDGLATFAPNEEKAYDVMGERLRDQGYLNV